MSEAAKPEGSTNQETVSKAEYEKMVERARTFEAKTTHFEKTFKGIDPERIKAIEEENLILKKQAATGDQTKIDQLIAEQKAELDKRYQTKFGELEAELGGHKKELKELRVVTKAMTKAADVFNTDALPLIRREIEANCDWDNGDIVVKGQDGKARPSKADPRKNMSIDEFIGELADTYASCAKPKGKPGVRPNGSADTSRANGAAGGDVTVDKYINMSPEEKRALPTKERVRLSQAAITQLSRN